MRTVCLLRCSTKKQADADEDFKVQRATIRRYLDEHKIEVAPADWRVEPAVSGKSKKRTELERIVEECRAEEVQRVVFANLARAGRLGAKTVVLLEDLHDWGVELVFVEQSEIDFSTYKGRAWVLINAALDILKLETVSVGTKAACVKDENGVKVSRKNGKRWGRRPVEWPKESVYLLRSMRAGERSAAEIADSEEILVLDSGKLRPAREWAIRAKCREMGI